MPTQITQIDNDIDRITTLRVEGELMVEDASLLERIGVDIRAATGNRIVVDLADLDFLDSDAAPYLKRIDSLDGFHLEGIEIFLQSVVDHAEGRAS